MMTNDKIIAVVQASTNGVPVEFRIIGSDCDWFISGDDGLDPAWNFMEREYRAKPREVWVNLINSNPSTVAGSEAVAKGYLGEVDSSPAIEWETVLFREVIE